MIRHIVFFNAKNQNDLDTIYTALKTLETIQGDWSLRVYKNAKIDQIANEIDIVVYGEFPDKKALLEYKNDPIYQQSTQKVRPLRNIRYAVDIEC